MGVVNLALLLTGSLCFVAFSWGVKGHFRAAGAMPAGMRVISVLSLAGFLWFCARLAIGEPPRDWPLAALLFCLSLAVFVWAIQATRSTPPTLAFAADRPSFLMRHGPYRHVRHPFYLSYLLFWAGTGFSGPGLVPWMVPLAMLVVYTEAASREEQKFAESDLARAYDAYRATTGMFLPRPVAMIAGEALNTK